MNTTIRDSAIEQPHFVVSCSQYDHNQRLRKFLMVDTINCDAQLAVPRIREVLRSYPHFLLVYPDEPRNGVWVQILVESEYVVTLFVDTLEKVLRFANELCIVCNGLEGSCVCPERSLPSERKWELFSEKFGMVTTQKEFARALGSKKDVLHLTLEFASPVLQSRETDEQPRDLLLDVGKWFEDAQALHYQWKRAQCPMDVYVAFTSFVRSISGKSFGEVIFTGWSELIKLLGDLFTFQNNNHWIDILDELWNNYGRARGSQLIEKLKSVLNHAIMYCALDKMGIKIDYEFLGLVEQKIVKPTLKNCFSFAHAFGDLMMFILKRGRQCFVAKSIEPFFIDSESVTKLIEECKRVRVDFEFLCNPEAIGLSVHSYLARLDDCLDKIKSVSKFVSKNDVEKRALSNLTIEMETLKKRYLSTESCSQYRKQPLAVVLFGHPGVGKSSLANIISTFDAKRRGRPLGSKFIYNHNSESEYFDLFRSYMHTIVFDDVSQHVTSRIQGVDPTISTLVKAINNIGWCVPQAALEDKGKTPLLCDLAIVTTNVADMGLQYYYNSTAAPMRRMPFRVTVKVKPEYCIEGTQQIDSNKVEDLGEFPDVWILEVCQAEYSTDGVAGRPRFVGEYKPYKTFHDLKDFLQWFGQYSDSHSRQQENFMKKLAMCGECELCDCKLPKKLCDCPTLQVDDESYLVAIPPRNWREEGMTLYKPKWISPFALKRWIDAHAAHPKHYVEHYAFEEYQEAINFGLDVEADFLAFVQSEYVANSLLLVNEEPGWWDTFASCITSLALSCKLFTWIFRVVTSWKFFKRLFRQIDHSLSREILMSAKWINFIGTSIDQKLGVRGTSALITVVSFFIVSKVMMSAAQAVSARVFKPNNVDFASKEETTPAPTEPSQFVEVFEDDVEVTEDTEDACASTTLSDDEKVVQLQSELDEIGKMPEPLNETERINPWSSTERVVTSKDFLPKRVMQTDVFERRVAHNTLCYTIHHKYPDGPINGVVGKKLEGKMIVLSNNKFLTNNHSMPRSGPIQITIHFGESCENRISPDVSLLIDQSQISRIENRDLCVVETMGLPQLFKDVGKNFVSKNFEGTFHGYYLVKGLDGTIVKKHVLGIRKERYRSQHGDLCLDMFCYVGWSANPEDKTESGDCGAPLVLETGYGPVVVGIHFAGQGEKVFATAFSSEDFAHFVQGPMVQCGDLPITEDDVFMRSKSYIDYHFGGNLMYHGELKGFQARPKHHFFHTEFFSQLEGREIGGHLVKNKLTAPLMDSWRPQQLGLSEFITTVDFVDESTVARSSVVFLEYIKKELPQQEVNLIHPVPLNVAVNGVPGIVYMDGIKRATSMGHPFNKAKTHYLEPLEDELWPDGVTFTQEALENIMEAYTCYKSGTRYHPIYKAHLKDEGVSFKKAAIGKTRIFFACPTSALIVFRMYFMSFSRVVQRNRKVFRCAVGLNPMSTEWDELYHNLTRHGLGRMIAGDFVFYDKKIKILFQRFVMSSIVTICSWSVHVSDSDLITMRALAEDLCNPSVDFFGCLITLLGGEVSGQAITTIFNCLVNLFYQMYCYEKVGYDQKDFFDKVATVTLGDDHVLGVAEDRSLFNHVAITHILSELGIGYTMADKEAESVPYIHISEVTFLKRSFRYEPDLGVYVAPLEVASIFKMMMVQIRSRSISPEEQLAQAICSAVSESFFHGREFFQGLTKFVNSAIKSRGLEIFMQQYMFHGYEYYVTRFWLCSNLPDAKAYCTGLQSQKSNLFDSNCSFSTSTTHVLERMDQEGLHARAFPEIRIYGTVELDRESCCKPLEIEMNPMVENKSLAEMTNQHYNEVHSGVPQTESSVSSNIQQTSFVNETVPISLDLETKHDPTADSQLVPAHLGEFFSRPAKVYSYTWTEGASAGIKASFKPWTLFFTIPAIKNKLENYGLMRATLKLKFTINASPFYYGAFGAFYTPLSGVVKDLTGVSTDAAGGQILISQKPHVWLDPQSTSTAEMTLPFLYNQNWLRTLSQTSLDNFGRIDLVQYDPLRSANGITGNGVNIIVYAWAENVEVTAPTSQPVLQVKSTEYKGNGQISGPASTIANIAKRLNDAPVVGPFAKATEVVAGAVGSVASFFGFTNVPNVKDVEPMKNLPFHALASSTISEPIAKLSLQPKQEVSISTTELGDPSDDQLHIANFCQRESFLCGSLWQTTNGENDILFTSCVTPELYYKSAGTNYALYNTPMAHALRMFKWWRGDIIFRFKVIRSQYHRGRINICWDATVNASSAMPGYGQPSVMNVLMDLEDSDEVEVRVPYMQPFPFTTKVDAAYNAQGPYWSNGTSPSFSGSGNGMIQVRVVNKLTAPELSSDVGLLVFVRAAENIEFGGPTSDWLQYTPFNLQSKETAITEVFGKPSYSDPRTYDEVFGEKIVSFRELLHRQSKAWTQVIDRTLDYGGTQMCYTMPFQRLPRTYGYSPQGWEVAKGTLVPASEFPFNYVRIHPLMWLTNCFVGYKGSVNYNFNVVDHNGKSQTSLASVSVTRIDDTYQAIKPFAFSTGNANSTSQLAKNYNNAGLMDSSGAAGMALTNQVTQAGISVNLPYYTNSKFLINNIDYEYSNSSVTGDNKFFDWYQLSIKRGITLNAPDNDLFVDIFVGTGPDFNLIFFLNCPVVYFCPSPIARTTG